MLFANFTSADVDLIKKHYLADARLYFSLMESELVEIGLTAYQISEWKKMTVAESYGYYRAALFEMGWDLPEEFAHHCVPLPFMQAGAVNDGSLIPFELSPAPQPVLCDAAVSLEEHQQHEFYREASALPFVVLDEEPIAEQVVASNFRLVPRPRIGDEDEVYAVLLEPETTYARLQSMAEVYHLQTGVYVDAVAYLQSAQLVSHPRDSVSYAEVLYERIEELFVYPRGCSAPYVDEWGVRHWWEQTPHSCVNSFGNLSVYFEAERNAVVLKAELLPEGTMFDSYGRPYGTWEVEENVYEEMWWDEQTGVHFAINDKRIMDIDKTTWDYEPWSVQPAWCLPNVGLCEPKPVYCSAAVDQPNFSRLVASAYTYGWTLTKTAEKTGDGYTTTLAAGGNRPLSRSGVAWDDLVELTASALVKFCESVGVLLLPADAGFDPVVWTVPRIVYVGADDLVASLNASSVLFPTVVRNRAYGQLFVLLRGDHSALYKAAGPCPYIQSNGHNIYGCEGETKLLIDDDYTVLPVDVSDSILKFRPWVHIVADNSWELAMQLLLWDKIAWPGMYTGAIGVDGKITAGYTTLKYSLAASTGIKFPGTESPFIVGPALQTNLTYLPNFTVPLVNVAYQVESIEAIICDAMNTTRQNGKQIVVSAMTKAQKKKLKAAQNKGKQMVVAQPVRVAQTRPVTVAGRDPKSGGVMPQNASVSRVELNKYLMCLADPFKADTGCKIPDMVIMKSTTFCIKQRLELTVATDGTFALYAFPWFRGSIVTNNVTNANTTFNWAASPVYDSPNLAALTPEFTMARPVAAAIKAAYAGKVLDGAGVITGGLLDPGSTLPFSYSALTIAPENREFQIAGDSNCVQVNWKPLTVHDQPYREITSWPIAAQGGNAAVANDATHYGWFSGSAGTVCATDKSVWISGSTISGAYYTHTPNGLAYMMVAGKGLTAGALVTIDFIAHFEATIRASSLTVGKLAPTASVSDAGAMSQTAAVLAQLPAVRKPDEGFVGKIVNIVKGVGDVVDAGFGVANRIKEGLKNFV